MELYLKRQLEQLLDEGGSQTLEVVVQLAAVGSDAQSVVRRASREAKARNAIVSSRDLAPKPFKSVSDANASSRDGSDSAPGSAAARRAALRPALQQETLRQLKCLTGAAAKTGRAPGVAFPAAGCALVRLSKDELQRLPQEMPGITALFRNQRVTIPPVSRELSLPHVVTDNRAHVWGLSRTGAMACWGAFDARGAGVKVAVLDTGVDAKHPDLDGRVLDFAEFDRTGKLIKSGVASAHDRDGHGTHVAATIVGGRHSGRWIGMAPDAKLLCAMVLRDGEGSAAQVLAGMQWALDQKADIISMSLGALQMSADVVPGIYDSMLIAAYLRGVPVVVAVGNEGAQTTSSPGNHFLAFTVGATDVEDRAAGFSGGRTQIVSESPHFDSRDLPLVYSKPDVSAPGVQIYSAQPSTQAKKRWAVLSGSSMATPHVSGAMALLLSCLPKLQDLDGPLKVRVLQGLLTSSVKELGEAGQNHRFGYGRIDVLRACGVGFERGYA